MASVTVADLPALGEDMTKCIWEDNTCSKTTLVRLDLIGVLCDKTWSSTW